MSPAAFTAIAATLSYVLSAEEVGTARVAPEEPTPITFPAEDVVFHGAMLYFGSSIYF